MKLLYLFFSIIYTLFLLTGTIDAHNNTLMKNHGLQGRKKPQVNFHIDDSLLLASYPEAGIKPTNPKSIVRTEFQHSVKLHFTPRNSTLKNYLIILLSAKNFI